MKARKKIDAPDGEWMNVKGFEISANEKTGSIVLDFGIADIAISAETAVSMAKTLIEAALVITNGDLPMPETTSVRVTQ